MRREGQRWGVSRGDVAAAVRRGSRVFSFRDDSVLFVVFSAFLRGWIVPVGDAIPDRREAELRGTHSQAALGNDRNKFLFFLGGFWGGDFF